MADPITVGGGGGIFHALDDYDVDITFVDQVYTSPNNDGNYSRPGYKISSLKIQDYGGSLIADLTPLLPSDRRCNFTMRFKHYGERVYVQGNPFILSFDDDLYPKANGRKRQSQGDRIEMELGTGRWGQIVARYPRLGWRIAFESEPI
jgi:hypothetical protein